MNQRLSMVKEIFDQYLFDKFQIPWRGIITIDIQDGIAFILHLSCPNPLFAPEHFVSLHNT